MRLTRTILKQNALERRKALKLGVTAIVAATFGPAGIGQQKRILEPKRLAPIDPKLVSQYVGASHRELDRSVNNLSRSLAV